MLHRPTQVGSNDIAVCCGREAEVEQMINDGLDDRRRFE
jgi:hypothetical protein